MLWQKKFNTYPIKNEKDYLHFYVSLNIFRWYIELKENVKPVQLLPYSVQRVHETMSKKEYKRLVKLGVIEEAKESEWGAPSFAQPKAKTNPARFLSYF